MVTRKQNKTFQNYCSLLNFVPKTTYFSLRHVALPLLSVIMLIKHSQSVCIHLADRLCAATQSDPLTNTTSMWRDMTVDYYHLKSQMDERQVFHDVVCRIVAVLISVSSHAALQPRGAPRRGGQSCDLTSISSD